MAVRIVRHMEMAHIRTNSDGGTTGGEYGNVKCCPEVPGYRHVGVFHNSHGPSAVHLLPATTYFIQDPKGKKQANNGNRGACGSLTSKKTPITLDVINLYGLRRESVDLQLVKHGDVCVTAFYYDTTGYSLYEFFIIGYSVLESETSAECNLQQHTDSDSFLSSMYCHWPIIVSILNIAISIIAASWALAADRQFSRTQTRLVDMINRRYDSVAIQSISHTNSLEPDVYRSGTNLRVLRSGKRREASAVFTIVRRMFTSTNTRSLCDVAGKFRKSRYNWSWAEGVPAVYIWVRTCARCRAPIAIGR
ncbi:hypothetical protein DEU56DRAFT_901642 [Suillus clintonianus]|uniref:uncharacterized protein n=1 Tax=Suillus clintonianus TaxID=1904413 RepID=UPI001B8641EE|nr:uncharacterized protein DEU56DRAFT_901642 [Suillus clintonianus]KAG2136014.1 hypothetical protein DEU56DRAFT_901642 [Suillus clintonianus]